MTSKKPQEDRTAAERRKGLTDKEIKDLELAGGVEGGMQAGSAGPSPKEKAAKRPKPRADDDSSA